MQAAYPACRNTATESKKTAEILAEVMSELRTRASDSARKATNLKEQHRHAYMPGLVAQHKILQKCCFFRQPGK
jgi:hypothetical protein